MQRFKSYNHDIVKVILTLWKIYYFTVSLGKISFLLNTKVARVSEQTFHLNLALHESSLHAFFFRMIVDYQMCDL